MRDLRLWPVIPRGGDLHLIAVNGTYLKLSNDQQERERVECETKGMTM